MNVLLFVQADWLLTSSRESLQTGSSWNLLLREAVPDAFLAAVQQAQQTDNQRTQLVWLRHLPNVALVEGQ